MSEINNIKKAQDFYNVQYRQDYERLMDVTKHVFYDTLISFIRGNKLEDKKALEIGSGRGLYQDVIKDYTGLDYSQSVSKYYHKPFVSCSADNIPFESDTFDFIWSYATLEHVIKLKEAFDEMIRVGCQDAIILLSPAWHCRRWAANGYQVRPYSDFGLLGKLYKAFIPIFDIKFVRLLAIMPHRVKWGGQYLFGKLINKDYKMPLYYRKLNANYDVFWLSDSDACNSIDNFAVWLYFVSRGHECMNVNSFVKAFINFEQAYVFRINKA